MDPVKIDVVMIWPQPQEVHLIFLNDPCNIALVDRGRSASCGAKLARSFIELKEKLVTITAITVLNGSINFVAYSDVGRRVYNVC